MRSRAVAAITVVVVAAISAAVVALASTGSGTPAPPAPSPVAFAAHTKAVIFGDSWTEGYTADPITHGYAYLVCADMKWDCTVDGASETGYYNPGRWGAGNYLHRLETREPDPGVELLIMQGGLNDADAPLSDAEQVIGRTLDEAEAKYPNARIVLVGPAAPVSPAPASLDTIDAALRAVAARDNLPYVSPLKDGWVNDKNRASVIDPVSIHPSTAGHEYLARRVEAALKAIDW